MLKMSKIALAGAAAVVALASTGANAATQSATAEVKIVSAVVLTKYQDLDLGSVAVGSTAGTVTMAASSATAATCSTGLTCFGAAKAARLRVTTAAQGATIAIGGSSSISLTGPTGSTAMTLTLNRSTSSINFDSANLVDIYVGGQLAVGASQAAGTYNGTFNVTADYQ